MGLGHSPAERKRWAYRAEVKALSRQVKILHTGKTTPLRPQFHVLLKRGEGRNEHRRHKADRTLPSKILFSGAID